MNRFEPSESYVLVRVLDATDKSAGGILLPSGDGGPERGEVRAVGPGRAVFRPRMVLAYLLTP